MQNQATWGGLAVREKKNKNWQDFIRGEKDVWKGRGCAGQLFPIHDVARGLEKIICDPSYDGGKKRGPIHANKQSLNVSR